MYHADIDSMFLNSKKAGRRHTDRKRKATEQAARLVKGGQGPEWFTRVTFVATGRLDSTNVFGPLSFFPNRPETIEGFA